MRVSPEALLVVADGRVRVPHDSVEIGEIPGVAQGGGVGLHQVMQDLQGPGVVSLLHQSFRARDKDEVRGLDLESELPAEATAVAPSRNTTW